MPPAAAHLEEAALAIAQALHAGLGGGAGGFHPAGEGELGVSLCDYPNLPEQERNKAEARYARVLERQLGSAEQVSETLSLVQGLEDMPPEEISEDAKLAFTGVVTQGDGEGGFLHVHGSRDEDDDWRNIQY